MPPGVPVRQQIEVLPLPTPPPAAGNTPDGDVIHLPPELLHRIVRCMAGPGSEAAWVPLVGELPRWVDLNSNH